MSKGFKKELIKIDSHIEDIKKYIERGFRMYHMLHYWQDKRMELVDKIGRK